MQDNIDSNGVARYPVGSWPILDPENGEVLVDEVGRRSSIASIAYSPQRHARVHREEPPGPIA